MQATYLAADNKLYIYDGANRAASSSALSPSALEELDIVFKWDIVTPKMEIWVNGRFEWQRSRVHVSQR